MSTSVQRQERCVGLKWWGSVSDVGALHVADNGLGEKGGTEVAKALLNNTTLKKLYLDSE
mgnify:FL=1